MQGRDCQEARGPRGPPHARLFGQPRGETARIRAIRRELLPELRVPFHVSTLYNWVLDSLHLYIFDLSKLLTDNTVN